MKRLIVLLIVANLFCSCGREKTSDITQHYFPERIVDLAIELHDDNVIELPGLYDNLATTLPEYDTIKLGEILKKKGFVFVEGGKGNHPPNGVRYVSQTYSKENCNCTVFKTYNSTLAEGEYEISEGISCTGIKSKQQ